MNPKKLKPKKGDVKADALKLKAGAVNKDGGAPNVTDKIHRKCAVLGSDAKAVVVSKGSKMHSILMKTLKTCEDKMLKKDTQKILLALQQKVFNENPKGVKELILEGAKLVKKMSTVKK